MGYYHPVAKKGNQADIARQYGVAGVNYGTKNNLGGQQIRTVNDVERGISAAMANDYSTREFLKHNDEAREAMKNGVPSNRKQNTKLYEMMKQAHKDDGNGGKYSSVADRAGVAQSAFESYEARQQDASRAYTDKKFNKLDNKFNKEKTPGEEASSNMSYNEYLAKADTEKATSGFSAAAKGGADGSADKAAQDLLSSRVKDIASDKQMVAKGQVGQGKYVLNELGKDPNFFKGAL